MLPVETGTEISRCYKEKLHKVVQNKGFQSIHDEDARSSSSPLLPWLHCAGTQQWGESGTVSLQVDPQKWQFLKQMTSWVFQFCVHHFGEWDLLQPLISWAKCLRLSDTAPKICKLKSSQFQNEFFGLLLICFEELVRKLVIATLKMWSVQVTMKSSRCGKHFALWKPKPRVLWEQNIHSIL